MVFLRGQCCALKTSAASGERRAQTVCTVMDSWRARVSYFCLRPDGLEYYTSADDLAAGRLPKRCPPGGRLALTPGCPAIFLS